MGTKAFNYDDQKSSLGTNAKTTDRKLYWNFEVTGVDDIARRSVGLIRKKNNHRRNNKSFL